MAIGFLFFQFVVYNVLEPPGPMDVASFCCL